MTRKSSKSGKSNRLKQSSEDIQNSESQMEAVPEQTDQDQLAQGDQTAEEEVESDEEPVADAPTLTELIINKFSGDKINDQFEGYGLMEFANGNTYEGEFVQGKMHGRGRYTWTETGMQYEGDFFCNRITGVGKYSWPDGSHYEGSVLNGVRHGYGVFSHPSGLHYEGEWNFGAKQGKGKLNYDSSGHNYYDGQWLADKRHGRGVRQYGSGNSYDGMWYAGQRHGQGVMRWLDKDEVYTGQWEDGVQHGSGQHVWFLRRIAGSQYVSRNVYEGEFHRGQRHGCGTFFYPSGSRYEGEWANDLKSGRGKFVFKNGRVYEGQFKNDRMVEFPEFEHDGRTTPDHSSIRTRSPLPGEAPSLHSNPSVNSLSPGFQLALDHLFAGEERLADFDCEEETAQAGYVAIHNLGKLRRIYSFYAALGAADAEDNANVLTMLQFWRLLKDCDVPNEDWTLARLNRRLTSNYVQMQADTMHNPGLHVVFLDFLNHLVTVAYHLFGSTVKAERGFLASCFRSLLREKIFPNACRVGGRFLNDEQQAARGLEFARDLWPAFQQICREQQQLKRHLDRCGSRRRVILAGCPRRSLNFDSGNEESVMTVRDFLITLKEYGVFASDSSSSEGTSTSNWTERVVQLLADDDRSLNADGCLLLDRELTFLEFLECVIGCSVAFAPSPKSAEAAEVAEVAEVAEGAEAGEVGEAAEAVEGAEAGDDAVKTPRAEAAPTKEAELLVVVVGEAPSGSQPPLPDENHLLRKQLRLQQKLQQAQLLESGEGEAADGQGGAGIASVGGVATASAASAGGETPKSPADGQHGRLGKEAAGKEAGRKQRGSLRTGHSDGKAGSKDSSRPPASRGREQPPAAAAAAAAAADRKADSSRKSLKTSESEAAPTVAGASSGVKDATEGGDDARLNSPEATGLTSSDFDQQQQQQQRQQQADELEEFAHLPPEERELAAAAKRHQRWCQQLDAFIGARLLPAAQSRALVRHRLEIRRQQEALESRVSLATSAQPETEEAANSDNEAADSAHESTGREKMVIEIGVSE